MAAEHLPLLVMRGSYAYMTRTEKRIADYVSANMDAVMEQTISELAAAVGSSEITISRFCKKLGFSGLQSFKIALAAELHTQTDMVYQDIDAADTREVVVQKVFHNIADGLSDTLKLLDYAAIERAVGLLRAARRIAVYGFGNSATVCRDIETRFLRFGMVVQAYSDAHQQATSAALLTAGDAVIAVSHTGATIELLDTVRTARQAGAAVIVITSYAHSPLAKLGDVVLHGMGREVHYSSEAVSSRLIHMAITDALYTLMAMQSPKEYRCNLQKMRTVIAKKRL
nr:MurR/RpiR family transcriptional regulator [uncultured Selenomonas sp.]